MSEYAEIIITDHDLGMGRYYQTYAWCGKPTDLIMINDRYKDGIKNLPWPLRLIDRTCDMGIYVRKDAFLGIYQLWVRLMVFARRITGKTYYRLIMTAMVWGLAYIPEAEIPHWKHLGKKRP